MTSRKCQRAQSKNRTKIGIFLVDIFSVESEKQGKFAWHWALFDRIKIGMLVENF